MEKYKDDLFEINKHNPLDGYDKEQLYKVSLKKDVLPIRLYQLSRDREIEIEKAKAHLMRDFISFILYDNKSKYNTEALIDQNDEGVDNV